MSKKVATLASLGGDKDKEDGGQRSGEEIILGNRPEIGVRDVNQPERHHQRGYKVAKQNDRDERVKLRPATTELARRTNKSEHGG